MVKLFSPAKINLFFRVLNKRPDGFHEIASLFQAISLGDDLEIVRAESDRLTCDREEIPLDTANLVLKAAAIFRLKSSIPIFAHFHLTKRIPTQTGLGGGSSNAATTLWGLNQLLGNPFSLETLQVWGGEIGSDVPFFLSQGTAYCTGRGERIKEMNPLQGSCTIAKPSDISLSTPLVFSRCKPQLFLPRDPLLALESFQTHNPTYFNDLEGPSFQISPYLSTLKQQLLLSGFKTVTMTGSGSAFFCIGTGTPPSNTQFFPTTFLNRQKDMWYCPTPTSPTPS